VICCLALMYHSYPHLSLVSSRAVRSLSCVPAQQERCWPFKAAHAFGSSKMSVNYDDMLKNMPRAGTSMSMDLEVEIYPTARFTLSPAARNRRQVVWLLSTMSHLASNSLFRSNHLPRAIIWARDIDFAGGRPRTRKPLRPIGLGREMASCLTKPRSSMDSQYL
jgi:hypothetical protein